MKSVLSQLFAVVGLAMLAGGLWWLHPPTCLIVVGSLLLTAGIIGAMR